MRKLIFLLLLMSLSHHAFGFMTAREARHKATQERLKKERECISNFKTDTQRSIDEAINNGESSATSRCYECNHGLPAFAKKLEDLGYNVRFMQCSENGTKKQLNVSW